MSIATVYACDRCGVEHTQQGVLAGRLLPAGWSRVDLSRTLDRDGIAMLQSIVCGSCSEMIALAITPQEGDAFNQSVRDANERTRSEHAEREQRTAARVAVIPPQPMTEVGTGATP